MTQKKKNNLAVLGALLVSGFVPACGCGDDDGDGNSNVDAAAVDGPTADADLNAFPVLGAQLDRVGRAAISTAVIKSMIYVDQGDKDAFEDMYNSDDNAAGWSAAYAVEIGIHLGVLDSLDSDIPGTPAEACGTQPFYDVNNDYTTLAGALADDRLNINTASIVCEQYLAVEATLAGGDFGADCGGRTPNMDVVDASYNGLSLGDIEGATVRDGVPPTMTAQSTVFPFLGEPINTL